MLTNVAKKRSFKGATPEKAVIGWNRAVSRRAGPSLKRDEPDFPPEQKGKRRAHNGPGALLKTSVGLKVRTAAERCLWRSNGGGGG